MAQFPAQDIDTVRRSSLTLQHEQSYQNGQRSWAELSEWEAEVRLEYRVIYLNEIVSRMREAYTHRVISFKTSTQPATVLGCFAPRPINTSF